jgi:hypothetical protein
VAGQDDRDRVGAIRGPDGAGAVRAADVPRLFAVAARLAVGDLGQCTPAGQLELGPRRRERNVERLALAGEVLTQLRGHSIEERRRRRRLAKPAERKPRERAIALDERQRTDGRIDDHPATAHRCCTA